MASDALEGQCLILFAVTMFFCIFCFVMVTLRCFTRMSIKGFGSDDWLMLIGTIFGVLTFITVLCGCKAGLGQRDYDLTEEDYSKIKRALMTFQVLYCASLIFIKSSICVALIRLVISRRLLYTLYAILALSASYGFVAMMTVLLQCRPLKATWDPSAGTCSNQGVIVRISYFVTACSITTDFACAVMPFVILWNLQMSKRLKFTVAAMLSLGFLASAATIVRIKYLDSYFATQDLAYKVSNVVLWSIIETGIAIIVGSIPSLKPLVKSIPFFGSHRSRLETKSLTRLDDFQSFAMRSAGPQNHKTHISGASAKDRDPDEEDSMKDSLMNDPGIILVRSEIQVEEGSRPNTGYKSFKSFTF
ncbi:hypothetical protein AUEXF2481DRAFT_254676 [Aureobasidium subglaciale EXF-2481]|uniref:Rhodopsin domain-containing protein n=1 Tax=Aureobasidium subglaciale (strain EXF-2481) TaxID=1043005 RepID=A0A074YKV9_AURSE|nr:uncharacterized protein AUEXF2481DRAFT_254676 [Aureobasidium subglaciale EXF-2481]KAI5212403.1 hypothetical protein E4T38_00461 [Aureobasidium subglaciale]KAI5231569.1 hypothetical protein E4T40_00443 [Aureobasidium subglaciale]KAI5234466.1 hypothetical protein E4T41_00460 [Aureobasidium subglaciale]KAI5267840.1 hypothetical protein E4T46_00460 [Aureobasidium subglaciale]KEQ94727.1 hypothetical protein AUEXF2481DRAFT_254676 [Aureobasidium subglaciale EXF-2481]